MPGVNETLVEVVRFEAEGLDEVAARTKAYAAIVSDVEARQRRLAGLMGDGAYKGYSSTLDKLTQNIERQTAALRNQAYARSAGGSIQAHTADMLKLNRQYDLMKGRVGVQVLKGDVASGAYAKQAAAMQAVNRQADLLRARGDNQVLAGDLKSGDYLKNAAAMSQVARQRERLTAVGNNRGLAADLKSGAFAKHASDMARLNAEAAKLNQVAHVQQLVAEHGRFGAAIRANADNLGTLKNAALLGIGGITAMGVGLTRSGLSGTVEGYRLEQSWVRLSRSVATVFLPIVEKVTQVVSRVAYWFESLSSGQRNTIARLGAFALVGLTAAAALSKLYTIGVATIGMMRTMGIVSAATAVQVGAANAATGIGGAAGGKGVKGAAGGGMMGMGGSMSQALAFAVVAAAVAAHVAEAEERGGGVKGYGVQAAKLAYMSNPLGAASTTTGINPHRWAFTKIGGYSDADYEKTANWYGKKVGLGNSFFYDTPEEKAKKKEAEDKKNGLNNLGGQFSELGENWFKIQEEVMKRTSETASTADGDSAKTFEEIRDWMKRNDNLIGVIDPIAGILSKIAGAL